MIKQLLSLTILLIAWSDRPAIHLNTDTYMARSFRGRHGVITRIVNGWRKPDEHSDNSVLFVLDNFQMTVSEYPDGGDPMTASRKTYQYQEESGDGSTFDIKQGSRCLGYLYVDRKNRQLDLRMTKDRNNYTLTIWDRQP